MTGIYSLHTPKNNFLFKKVGLIQSGTVPYKITVFGENIQNQKVISSRSNSTLFGLPH
jgi:hypothetical protein